MNNLVENKTVTQSISVLIADDNHEIRNSLRLLLSTFEHITIVGLATNGVEALSLTHTLQPEVIILDIEMPEMNGIEAAKLIREEIPETKVLIFSAFDTADYIKKIFLSRAQGYIVKGEVKDIELIKAIETVYKGGLYFSQSPSQVLQNILSENIDGPMSDPQVLSEREQNIIGKLAQNQTAISIANELNYDLEAFERHVERILLKLDLNGHDELIQFANENGFA